MSASAHEAPTRAPLRPPSALWFPFAVLVLLGVGTTLTGIAYLAVITSGLLAGASGLQWQAFPYGFGLLAGGVGALLGAFALWRQQRRARVIALLVLPVCVAAGALDGLVVEDTWGLRVDAFIAASLIIPAAAWAVFFLPSVRRYYQRQVQ